MYHLLYVLSINVRAPRAAMGNNFYELRINSAIIFLLYQFSEGLNHPVYEN